MNFADHDHGMLPECGHDALDAVSHVAGRVRLCGCMPGFRCRNSTGRSVPARDALRKPVLDLFERAGIPAAKGRSQRSFLKMPPTSQQQATDQGAKRDRSEEHTSELQSQSNLVCRLLLEKKKH